MVFDSNIAMGDHDHRDAAVGQMLNSCKIGFNFQMGGPGTLYLEWIHVMLLETSSLRGQSATITGPEERVFHSCVATLYYPTTIHKTPHLIAAIRKTDSEVDDVRPYFNDVVYLHFLSRTFRGDDGGVKEERERLPTPSSVFLVDLEKKLLLSPAI